jgi:hypothetical protein
MLFNKINPTYYRKGIITIIFILLVSYSLTTSTYTDCYTETDIVYIKKQGKSIIGVIADIYDNQKLKSPVMMQKNEDINLVTFVNPDSVTE